MEALNQRGRSVTVAVLAAVILVIIAVGFGYYYSAENSEISSLKKSGQTVCKTLDGLYDPLMTLISNETESLNGQIRSGNALIASLNSTRPPSYTSMIVNLKKDMIQDNQMLALISNLTLTMTSLGGLNNPCSAFG